MAVLRLGAALVFVAISTLTMPLGSEGQAPPYLTQWGTLGAGNGQFYGPYDVAVDAGGNVYVVDSGNERIQKFTSTGTYITKWGTEGSGDGEFFQPSGIAVDASGYVYVSDLNNNRIQKFS